MKKTLILAVVALSLTTVSCKKDRTCDCTVTETKVTTNPAGSFTNSDTWTTKQTAEKQSKKYFRMDNNCYNSTETDTKISGNQTTVTTTGSSCTLK